MSADTVVVGLGNTIRGDDAIGILALRALRETASHALLDRTHFKESGDASIHTLELIRGYRRVRIVDSIQTQNGHPGDIYPLRMEDLPRQRAPHSLHHFGLPGMLRLATHLGMTLPEDILLYAIEIKCADHFSTTMNPEVERSIRVLQVLLSTDLANHVRPGPTGDRA